MDLSFLDLSESSEYSYFAEIFHASFLARDKKDIKAARAIYENEILNHDPKVASHWISYVELEFYYGNVEKCHSVMKKAYNTFCPPNYLMAFNEEAEELLKLTHFYEKFCRKVGFPLKQGISGNDWNPLLACLKVAMTEKTSGNKEVAPSKPNSHTTLFLSNLDFNTNPEHLKEFLESVSDLNKRYSFS